MGNKLLFIGSLMVDMVCPISAFPKPGAGVVSEDFSLSLGGCAFNAAHAAQQAGADCFLLAPLGQGPFANFISGQLEAFGLKPLQVETTMDCGAAVCLVQPSGERTMITLPGVERHFEGSWFEGFDASDFDWAYLCGYELAGQGGEHILDFLESNPHMQVVFGPGPVVGQISEDRIQRINKLRPIWHLNEVESARFTGTADIEAAGRQLELAARNYVIITEGPKGAHLFCRGKHSLVPTQPVRAIDTIGAGDNHIGVLMACLSQGKDLEQATAMANRISGGVCCVKGSILTDERFNALLPTPN